jgi:hypothetical protein
MNRQRRQPGVSSAPPMLSNTPERPAATAAASRHSPDAGAQLAAAQEACGVPVWLVHRAPLCVIPLVAVSNLPQILLLHCLCRPRSCLHGPLLPLPLGVAMRCLGGRQRGQAAAAGGKQRGAMQRGWSFCRLTQPVGKASWGRDETAAPPLTGCLLGKGACCWCCCSCIPQPSAGGTGAGGVERWRGGRGTGKLGHPPMQWCGARTRGWHSAVMLLIASGGELACRGGIRLQARTSATQAGAHGWRLVRVQMCRRQTRRRIMAGGRPMRAACPRSEGDGVLSSRGRGRRTKCGADRCSRLRGKAVPAAARLLVDQAARYMTCKALHCTALHTCSAPRWPAPAGRALRRARPPCPSSRHRWAPAP